MDIQGARINTAGAYVRIQGLYAFGIGTQTYNGHIPVFRLGGHRQEQETGWQCAAREVGEEAGLQIAPLTPPATYLADGDHVETELLEVPWRCETDQERIPWLVVAYRRDDVTLLSLMYLAQAEGLPTLLSEVMGLLLLRAEDVHRLCRESLTLREYLRGDGKAILNYEFDQSLTLEPFIQLRLLSRMLRARPETTAHGLAAASG